MRLLALLMFFLFFFADDVSAISLSISNVPSSINADQEFTTDIVLTCSGCGISYLRGVFFYPESSTNYSGYTQNTIGEWTNLSGSPSSFFKIDSGSWSGQIKFKFDSEKPASEYYFKVGRYTASGTSFSQVSDSVAIIVSPTPTPIPSPTESSTPTATSTPTETLTQTPTPTPAKSIYKINKSKDQNNQLISSVKIYVDNLYTHHEDDEIMEFCDGCFCDDAKTIQCGYGEHTIKLTKTEYSDWSELRNFIQGASYEITPILTKISSEPTTTGTSTPTPTPTPSLAVSITTTPTASPSPPDEFDVLGSSDSALPPDSPPTPTQIIPENEDSFVGTTTLFGATAATIVLLSLAFWRLRKLSKPAKIKPQIWKESTSPVLPKKPKP